MNGFAHGLTKGRINQKQANAWNAQLESSDLDDLLGAAEFMGRKLDAPHGDLYARWLDNVFNPVQPKNERMKQVIQGIHDARIPIGTLNFDSLLERATSLPTINLHETAKVTAWMRRDVPGILHLHGTWDVPATCILGIRDYETTLGNDVRDLLQRNLATFRRLLFIGCGDTFADPNFSALIQWLRARMKNAALEHYALVTEGEVAARHADPSWHGFVEPISYGMSHSDLPEFLLKHFATPKTSGAKKKGAPAKGPARSVDSARLLREYRAFLAGDCGQMTIEGVRADMDTAQRRFDLERLFVPLKVQLCQPEFPENDPERAQKLALWREEHQNPMSFGEVLARYPRIALLALPGGGKTLLLKRLAVAYADPTRRRSSNDSLPEIDLTPVLIRCREWREHIHRPIVTLLQNLPSITGLASLVGINEALLPLFKAGRVLLLVDGLDEIHDDALRSTFVEHLETFLEEYKQTRLVVTSREAGFSLVAPCLARFCERWRVAPLEEDAIATLCDYWHNLMAGSSLAAKAEGQEVAQHLLRNASLRRLAENPLLLTMLLVVKHGNGRLPPDRVSLYSRAVEVLLDTWNIKGHAPLNPKEAVPQLAYVAMQLMRLGKQTATEKDLLAILEEARDNVPQIRRYAKDTPIEFLRRVELRSSLLVEAGHQADGKDTVPFYQFRHLTFQEYLAAVAAVEGHYAEYKKSDTVLTPLAPYLVASEWKEIIPMAAVLARKQAEPLIASLVAEGSKVRADIESGKMSDHSSSLPPPIARLVQCLVEETEAAPETLTAALQMTAFFARGCTSAEDWTALIRGPYGEELWHQAWLLYEPMRWPSETFLINTCPALAALRHTNSFWEGTDGQAEIGRLLANSQREEIALGLFTVAGLLRPHPLGRGGTNDSRIELRAVEPHLKDVERRLFEPDQALWSAAARALGWFYNNSASGARVSNQVRDRLLTLWLSDAHVMATGRAGFALAGYCKDLQRNLWCPALTDPQLQSVRRRLVDSVPEGQIGKTTALIVAFFARTVCSDEELSEHLARYRDHEGGRGQLTLEWILNEMGQPGYQALYGKTAQGRRKRSRGPESP